MYKKSFFTIIFLLLFVTQNAFATTLKVELTSAKKISTCNDSLHEGDNLNLVVFRNVYDGKKLIFKEGTAAKGLITTLTDNDFSSVPAEIFAEQFSVKTVSGNIVKLNGVVDKKGRNHFMFNQFLPFIITLERGGEAFILPQKDVFILFAEVKND